MLWCNCLTWSGKWRHEILIFKVLTKRWTHNCKSLILCLYMKTVFAKQVKINFTYVIGRDGDQHEIIAKHLNQSSIPIKLWWFSCSSCCSSLNSQKNEAGQHNNNNHLWKFLHYIKWRCKVAREPQSCRWSSLIFFSTRNSPGNSNLGLNYKWGLKFARLTHSDHVISTWQKIKLWLKPKGLKSYENHCGLVRKQCQRFLLILGSFNQGLDH